MNNEDLDLIKNITKEKIAISKFQKDKIMKNNIKFLYKTFTSVAACVILFSGILFSKNISQRIYALYKKNNNMEVATINAHTAKFDLDSEISQKEIVDLSNNESIAKDEIKIKVDEMTMDDTSLDITFIINLGPKINSKVDISGISGLEMKNVSITDENGNILYCDNKEKIIELLGLDPSSQEAIDCYTKDEYLKNERYFNSKYWDNLFGTSGNDIRINCRLTYFEQDKYYPKSQKINISIGGMDISVYDEGIEKSLNLEGNWNIKLDLPENVYTRQRNIYKEVNSQDDKNRVMTFSVLSTWTEVTLELLSDDTLREISPQLKLINAIEVGEPTTQLRDYFVDGLMASEEYKQYEEDLRKSYLIQDAFIEDENGKIYKLTKDRFSNAGRSNR